MQTDRIRCRPTAPRRVILLALVFCAILTRSSFSLALDLPALKPAINDLAAMMPAASVEDLQQRLQRFKTETGYTVVVLTLPNLGGEELEKIGPAAFKSLPLEESDLQKAILLIVARKEREVGVQFGAALRQRFPEAEAKRKLQAHVSLYIDGFRPDLGIYSAVNFIFRVLKGEFRVESVTDEEKLEEASTTGRSAGAIFTLCLAPYLSLVIGMLWGLYATNYRVQCTTRLFIGGLLGSGVAKAVAMIMVSLGRYGYDLWYFILAASILLAAAGSFTEFWMAGDWCAIPRVKDKVKRKPEDNMGI